MNKKEYFDKLAYELGNMDEATRAEILGDFHEHFEIAEKSGKSEEEICRILGDPREIAAEFTQDYVRSDDGAQQENTRGEIPQDCELTNRYNSSKVKGVTVELKTSRIEIRGEEREDAALDLGSYKAHRMFDINLTQDGILVIKEKFPASADISLTLPQIIKGLIKIESISGDICLGELSCEGLKIKTASGNVEICASNIAAAFNVTTGSGDVITDACNSAQGFNVSTGSGAIEFNACNGKISASTGSGEIIVEAHLNGTVIGCTGSGDIAISTGTLNGDINYSTGSGDIEITCETFKGNIRMSSGSGDINFETNEVGGDIHAKTSSGDIELTLGGHNDINFDIKAGRNSDVTNEFMPNNQGSRYKVKLKTNSGDIEVLKK